MKAKYFAIYVVLLFTIFSSGCALRIGGPRGFQVGLGDSLASQVAPEQGKIVESPRRPAIQPQGWETWWTATATNTQPLDGSGRKIGRPAREGEVVEERKSDGYMYHILGPNGTAETWFEKTQLSMAGVFVDSDVPSEHWHGCPGGCPDQPEYAIFHIRRGLSVIRKTVNMTLPETSPDGVANFLRGSSTLTSAGKRAIADFYAQVRGRVSKIVVTCERDGVWLAASTPQEAARKNEALAGASCDSSAYYLIAELGFTGQIERVNLGANGRGWRTEDPAVRRCLFEAHLR